MDHSWSNNMVRNCFKTNLLKTLLNTFKTIRTPLKNNLKHIKSTQKKHIKQTHTKKH